MRLISVSTPIVTDSSYTRLVRLFGSGLAVLALGACASMSEKDCLTADWADQGYRDGRDGYPLSRVEDHREACAKVGVLPDVLRYRAGREEGLREYCTPANAIREGRLGRSYRNACPARIESMFLSYHAQGYRAYEAQQRVDSLDRELQRTQRALDKAKHEGQRRRLRAELRELDRDLSRARSELRDEERRLSAVSAASW